MGSQFGSIFSLQYLRSATLSSHVNLNQSKPHLHSILLSLSHIVPPCLNQLLYDSLIFKNLFFLDINYKKISLMHLQRLSLSAQASEAHLRTFWGIVSCLVSWSSFFSSLVSPSLVSFLKSETSVSLTSHRISTSSEPACELRPKPTSLPNGLGPHGMLCTQQGLDQGHPFLFRCFPRCDFSRFSCRMPSPAE